MNYDYKIDDKQSQQQRHNDFDEKRIAKQSWSYDDLIGQQKEWTPRRSPRSVSASGYVNALDDMVMVDTSAGGVVLIVESSYGVGGRTHIFKKTTSDGNALTLISADGGLFDGQTVWSSTLPYACFIIKAAPPNWAVITGGLTFLANQYSIGAPLLDLDDMVPDLTGVAAVFATSGPFSATPPTLTLDSSIPSVSVIATSP